jgi:thioredoxin reductase (NADPH)
MMGGENVSRRTFTVLSRQWCHLCQERVAALEPVAGQYGWAVEIVDVDQHPELEARWNELVPVLLAGDREICHHHLDDAAVRAWCRQAGHERHQASPQR